VYDVGKREWHNDESGNYHQSAPFNLNINQDPNNVDNGVVECAWNNVSAFEIQLPQ